MNPQFYLVLTTDGKMLLFLVQLYILVHIIFQISYDLNISPLRRSSNYKGGFELTLKYTNPEIFGVGSAASLDQNSCSHNTGTVILIKILLSSLFSFMYIVIVGIYNSPSTKNVVYE